MLQHLYLVKILSNWDKKHFLFLLNSFRAGSCRQRPEGCSGQSPLPGCDGRTERKFLDAKGDEALGFRMSPKSNRESE